MDRRDLLKAVGSAALLRATAGCDRLVLMGEPSSAELLPITPNEAFYVYSYSGTPDIDPGSHETVIAAGDVELARISLAFLEGLEAVDKEHTLECIGARPRIQNISNAVWSGLPLVDVLDALGVEVPESAVGLRLVGVDGYHAGLPIEELLDGPIWLVWRMNGEPLPVEHGAPARLLVPGRYGVKNLKWIAEIAFVDTLHESYWTPLGWSEAATYLPNTLIVSPIEGLVVDVGMRVRLLGTAFAGRDVVQRVDVAVDGGRWQEATLDYATGEPDVWVLWSFDWTATDGDHTIQVRCTTTSGAVSAADPDGTDSWSGYDGSMEIRIEGRG